MNLSAVFKQTSRCLPNVFGSFGIIHRVQMKAGNALRHQIDDLIDCVCQTGCPERFRIILILVQNGRKFLWQRCRTCLSNSQGLIAPDDRHDAGNDRRIDVC